MALGEPKHALWQFWNPSIFDGINQKKDKKEDIYVLLFDESLIQQLKKNQLDIQAILELSYRFKYKTERVVIVSLSNGPLPF